MTFLVDLQMFFLQQNRRYVITRKIKKITFKNFLNVPKNMTNLFQVWQMNLRQFSKMYYRVRVNHLIFTKIGDNYSRSYLFSKDVKNTL